MRWPFQKQRTEHRASATDALVAAIQASAGGGALADSNALASLETAVSLYSSAFAAARVRSEGPVADLLTPEYLAMAVRAMLRRGEFLTVLDVTPADGLTFAPCGSWDVRGGDGLSGIGGIAATCKGRAGPRRGRSRPRQCSA